MLGSLDYGAGGWETAAIRMLPTGKVEVVVGVSPHGQGHETAFSQIVADQLGVGFDDVEILHGDTQSSYRGLDTYGSRSLAVGGIAVVKAAEKVIEKAKPIAAHMLEASEGDLEFAAGKFSVKGTDKGVGIQDIALAVFAAHDYPEGIEPDIDAHATFDPENFSFPHGTHLCAVEVDTETGFVSMYKYVCVDDVGNVINPLIVEGQVHGGLAQGIAQALFEEAAYDDQGTLLSGTLVDYTLPSAADLISFDTANTTTASTTNPLGVKGVGEAGHDRLHPGGRELGARRDPAPRRQGHRHADHPLPRLERHPERRRGPPAAPTRRTSPRRVPVSAPPPVTCPREATCDPGPVRLRPAHHGRGGAAGPARRRRRRQAPGRRPEPAAGAAAAHGRPVADHRPRRHPGAAGRPRGRRRGRRRGHDVAPRRHP